MSDNALLNIQFLSSMLHAFELILALLVYKLI